MTISKERDQQIHERALKLQRDIGSDLYRIEDYYDIARRLIEQEEELGLPVDPYPLNQEAGERDRLKKGAADERRRKSKDAKKLSS